ncbi:hypothetical protein [Glycomyces buryatensis]|uniref:Uncharacterized protein n=1 Tax=Glycomyces buryatensis TaxID=2570927 RepID=A0A4S8QJH0_9ACTN|nr:hypothetical protein [Glycomyces buryatensis]THV41529.1 hypothetical protein FAB82_10485 [Glycomyces buryatensis]
MRKRNAYLIVGAAALVAAAGIAIVLAQAATPDAPAPGGPDGIVSPTGEVSGQLTGDELSEHWDSERMSEAEPPDMSE